MKPEIGMIYVFLVQPGHFMADQPRFGGSRFEQNEVVFSRKWWYLTRKLAMSQVSSFANLDHEILLTLYWHLYNINPYTIFFGHNSHTNTHFYSEMGVGRVEQAILDHKYGFEAGHKLLKP